MLMEELRPSALILRIDVDLACTKQRLDYRLVKTQPMRLG
jgi:hypothetical protein